MLRLGTVAGDPYGALLRERCAYKRKGRRFEPVSAHENRAWDVRRTLGTRNMTVGRDPLPRISRGGPVRGLPPDAYCS